MPPRVQPYASSSSLLQPVAGPSTSNARQIANVNAQVAANSLNDQHDIVSVIEIQDALDAMPLELTKCFGDLRELDAVLNATITHLTERLSKLSASIRDPSLQPPDRFQLLLEIAEEVTRFKLGGEDKIRVAGNACEMLITHQSHVSSLLQSSTLLTPNHPLNLPASHLLMKRPRGSPMPARGDVTPSKRRKTKVQDKEKEDWDEESVVGAPAGGAKKKGPQAKDKKIGLVKKKSANTSRLSPSESVLSGVGSTKAETSSTLPASGRAQRTTAGRNRTYEEEFAELDAGHGGGGGGGGGAEDDGTVDGGSPAPRSASVLGRTGGGGGSGGGGKNGKTGGKEGGKSTTGGGAGGKTKTSATTNARGGGKETSTPSLSVAVAIASGDASADGGEGDDSATYCYCHGLSAGEMIGCDAEDCPIEWFHLVCLGLDEPPAGDWLCPECTKARQTASSKGGKEKRAGAGGKAGQKVKVRR